MSFSRQHENVRCGICYQKLDKRSVSSSQKPAGIFNAGGLRYLPAINAQLWMSNIQLLSKVLATGASLV